MAREWGGNRRPVLASLRGVQPDGRQIGDQAAGPPIDVVFAHVGAHARHARAPLIGWHFQRPPNRVGKFLDVIGIHHQRIRQFVTGAGKAAENQHALLVGARRHILLRHQVHPIVQGSHQAEVSGPVVGQDLFVAVVLRQEDDWLPARSFENGG